MSRPPHSVFQERRAYRQRRMTDAARLLPVLGAVLLCLPMLWALDSSTPMATTDMFEYLFLAWLVLIVLAGVVSSRLPKVPQDLNEPAQQDNQDT
ncbi:MAG: hypothetical protein AB8B82_14625 [Roseovarius sp.]